MSGSKVGERILDNLQDLLNNIPSIPQNLLGLISGSKQKVEHDLTAEDIAEGIRNSYLTSLGGSMRKRGSSYEAIVSALLAENKTRCKPPLPESEVKRIAKSIARYEPGELPSQYGVNKPAIDFAECGTLLSDVEAETIRWLWPGYIALGKLTILDGDPGNGKTTATNDIASRVSTGREMPDGSAGVPPSGVVLISAEDSLADTIKPRLLAAGADCSRILALTIAYDEEGKERPITLPFDLELIRKAIERVDAKLVILDPLMAFLSGDTNSHKDQDIRRVLYPVSKLAEDTEAAFVIVRHLNKATGGNVLYRGGGSIGIIGAARTGLLVEKDPNDKNRRVLACTKSNIAMIPESLSFHLEDCNGVARVVWDGVSPHSANDLLSMQNNGAEKSASKEAEYFLYEILGFGPVQASKVIDEAKGAGISERTLNRAKKNIGVISHKPGGPKTQWVWELPQDANSAISQNVGNLNEFGNLNSSDTLPTLATLNEKPLDCQGSIDSQGGNLKEGVEEYEYLL
jgi:hypothetical protein